MPLAAMTTNVSEEDEPNAKALYERIMQRWLLQQQDLLEKLQQACPGKLARSLMAMWSWSFERHVAEVWVESFPDFLESYLCQIQGILPDLKNEKSPYFNPDLWRILMNNGGRLKDFVKGALAANACEGELGPHDLFFIPNAGKRGHLASI